MVEKCGALQIIFEIFLVIVRNEMSDIGYDKYLVEISLLHDNLIKVKKFLLER